MSKFAEAAAEYQRQLTEHRKCPRTCAKCHFSKCVDDDDECETCANFDRKNANVNAPRWSRAKTAHTTWR